VYLKLQVFHINFKFLRVYFFGFDKFCAFSLGDYKILIRIWRNISKNEEERKNILKVSTCGWNFVFEFIELFLIKFRINNH